MNANPIADTPLNTAGGFTERLFALAGVGVLAAGVSFVAYFDPAKTSFLPACPLLTLTGFACPGCGLTRGFHALFHGDIIPALDFNLMIPLWAVIFGYIFLALCVFAVWGRWIPMWLIRPKFLWSFLVALLSFGVLRNIPSWPFSILYP